MALVRKQLVLNCTFLGSMGSNRTEERNDDRVLGCNQEIYDEPHVTHGR